VVFPWDEGQMLRRGLGESLRRRRDHERISPPCLKIKKEAHKAQNGRGALVYGIEGMRDLQRSLVGFKSGKKSLEEIPKKNRTSPESRRKY